VRLFVRCPITGQQLILSYIATSRSQLPATFHLQNAACGHVHTFTRFQVQAESTPGATGAGAILGGLVGLLGGPIGAILGVLAGGGIGSNAERADREAADRFNRGG
jgi:uncharacterized protein YcfJ